MIYSILSCKYKIFKFITIYTFLVLITYRFVILSIVKGGEL